MQTASDFQSRILVKKYGGTSVGTLERIENVAARLETDIKRGEIPIVVASAMSGETNRLVAMAEKLDADYRGPAYDMLVASGEQVAIALLAIALQKRGIQAQPLLAYQLGIQTDKVYSKARIQKIDGEKLLSFCRKGIVPIVAGFQGVDEDDNITTLGRGGSDTTAVALAAAIQAQQCEIYTDVAAVCTADPRLVPGARELHKVSFEEMMEMAALGSKVLHIRCVEIAAKYGIRIHLRSTFETREGTWIVPEGEIMENALVTAVTHDANTFVFALHPIPAGSQFLGDLFEKLAAKGVIVDIITQSDTGSGQRLAFSVSKEDVPLTRQVLKEFLPTTVGIETMEGMAKISVVGVGMRNHPGVAATFFKTLAEENVPVLLVTTSEIKISAVIDNVHLQKAAQRLSSVFSLSQF
ncbi:MAG: aspartate kinase [Pseudobdellovibrionaceae bacterium]